jgi:hypothetical protein
MQAKESLKRYEALREMGCIACSINGYSAGIAEMHHLVDKGYRKHSGGNQATIPLCAWHHRGEPWMDFPVSYMRERFGPSMALESKTFSVEFGTQRELLAKVNELING